MLKIIYSFVIFISIFFKIHLSSSKAIILPLKYSYPNEPNQFEPNLIVTYYAKNNIYTTLSMGKPPNDLTVVLDDEDSSFTLREGSCPLESDYIISGSSTFKYDEGILYQYINNQLTVALNSTKDKIYLNQADKEYFYLSLKNRRNGKNLNKIEIDDFSFLYSPTQGEINELSKKPKKTDKKDNDDLNGDGYNDDVYQNEDNEYSEDNPFSPYYPGYEEDDDSAFSPKCGYMGLLPQGMTTGLNDVKLNFVQQLKNKRIIDNYNWFIRYNNDKTGELIIGAAPHEVRPENYLEEDLYITHARLINDLFYWEIDFSLIELFEEAENKRHNLGKSSGVITINSNFIHCPQAFYNHISTIFFKPYFERKICNLDTINKYDTINKVIYCHQRNFTDNDLKKFPILLLQSSELNYIFNLDYNDLFLKTRNVYIFKIIYSGEFGYWKLGKIFLEKYPFVFNYDSKTFGFYQKFIPENIDGDQIINPINNPNNHNNDNNKLPPSKRKELRDKEKNSGEKQSNILKILFIIGLVIIVLLIGFYMVRRFISFKQVNSNSIENNKKIGKKRKIDNAMLEDAEEIN